LELAELARADSDTKFHADDLALSPASEARR
jgi:hypothetical protein